MFKSITYLRYDEESNLYFYRLIDTDFECEVSADSSTVAAAPPAASLVVTIAATVVAEYERRKLPALPIFFKCNLYLNTKSDLTFEDILKFQHKYMDKYYPEIYFNEKYYDKLKDMWHKCKLFM